MSPPRTFSALVVGGGVNGLATAWHLALMGIERVALVERFRLHHDRGSSHGAGRITRSAYSDARYVRLVRVAHEQDWPRLVRDSGRTLIHPADGIFFGPPGVLVEEARRLPRADGVAIDQVPQGRSGTPDVNPLAERARIRREILASAPSTARAGWSSASLRSSRRWHPSQA